jgi:hypothetical protein
MPTLISTPWTNSSADPEGRCAAFRPIPVTLSPGLRLPPWTRPGHRARDPLLRRYSWRIAGRRLTLPRKLSNCTIVAGCRGRRPASVLIGSPIGSQNFVVFANVRMIENKVERSHSGHLVSELTAQLVTLCHQRLGECARWPSRPRTNSAQSVPCSSSDWWTLVRSWCPAAGESSQPLTVTSPGTRRPRCTPATTRIALNMSRFVS